MLHFTISSPYIWYYRLYLQISSPSHRHNLLQQMLEPLLSIIAPLPVSVYSLSHTLNEVFCFRRDFVSSCFSVPLLVIHILFVVSTTFSRAPRFVRPAVSQSVSQSVMAVTGSSTCALRRRCPGQTSVRSTRRMSSDFGWCCSQASCSSAPGCQKDASFSIDGSMDKCCRMPALYFRQNIRFIVRELVLV